MYTILKTAIMTPGIILAILLGWYGLRSQERAQVPWPLAQVRRESGANMSRKS
jgi:hypothetical protein